LAEYKRMISYMYRYNQDIKEENVGYARIEARNSECRFTLHIKTSNKKDENITTYLTKRKDEKLELLKLGESLIQNNLISSKYFTSEANILNSEYDLSDITGIVLYKDENFYFGTQWDSQPILLREIKEGLHSLKRTEKESYAIEELKVAEIESKEEDVEELESEALGLEKESEAKIIKTEESEAKENKIVKNEKEIDDLHATAAGVTGEVNAVPNTEILDYKYSNGVFGFSEGEDNDPGFAKEIFKDRQKENIFEDDKIIATVKIDTKDIEMLPKGLWGMMNNSFLLNGYYNFKHLIFAKSKDDDKAKYILGVPGVFQNRERFMARMFGFEYFKGTKKGNIKSGEFGYWIVYVEEE